MGPRGAVTFPFCLPGLGTLHAQPGRNHFLNLCARHTVTYGRTACVCQVIDLFALGTE